MEDINLVCSTAGLRGKLSGQNFLAGNCGSRQHHFEQFPSASSRHTLLARAKWAIWIGLFREVNLRSTCFPFAEATRDAKPIHQHFHSVYFFLEIHIFDT